jgi:outer membrane protein assembly factor BamB
MSADETPQPPFSSAVQRRRPRTPPTWMWIALPAIIGVIAIVRRADVFGDHAYANIAMWILGFTDIMIPAVWFFFFSGYRRESRWLTFAGCVVSLSVLAVLFRIDHVTGELLPTFVYRFSANPDRLLPLLPEGAAGGKSANVDLRTTTENDFPGFLGPDRSESVEHVKLSRDWTHHHPELLWKHEIGAGWSAFSVVNGHAVTMEQRGDMEMTTCYNVETGKLEWAHSTPGRFERMEAGVGPRSTPTIDGGMVFALGALGHLACLDGATGKPVWEKDLLKEFDIPPDDNAEIVLWGRSGSPLVVGQQVIVPIGGAKSGPLVSLAAFDAQSGAVLWKGGQRQISYSSPALATLADVRQILTVNEATASGHEVKTGKVLWEYDWPGRTNRDPNVSQAVPISPNRVLLSKGYGGGAMLLQLNPAAGSELTANEVWKNPRALKTKFSNVTVQGGYAYGLSDGILECADLADGLSKWKKGRYGHGQMLRAGDLLLVLTEQGAIVLVEATPDRPNNVLGRFQAIEGLTWNNLALYGPYLLVRNAEQAACYKLPLEER